MMFGKKKNNRMENPMNQNGYGNQQGGVPSFMYDYTQPTPNTHDFSRIDAEINELKRLNNEMLKRITRLENYLGVREKN